MSIGTELYNRAVAGLVSALRDAGDEIPRLMEALVAESFEASTLEAGTISSNETKLHTGTGALRRALIIGKPGNIYEKELDLFNSRFTYGVDEDVIKYANTHEFGDTRPITLKMRHFFWAKYFETGLEMWKGLALTKKTEITYKARPFIGPAFETFDRDELPAILDVIFTRMAIVFNAN